MGKQIAVIYLFKSIFVLGKDFGNQIPKTELLTFLSVEFQEWYEVKEQIIIEYNWTRLW